MLTKEELYAQLQELSSKDSLNDWARQTHYDVCPQAISLAKQFAACMPDGLPLPKEFQVEEEGQVCCEYWINDGKYVGEITFLTALQAEIQGFKIHAITYERDTHNDFTGNLVTSLYEWLSKNLVTENA